MQCLKFIIKKKRCDLVLGLLYLLENFKILKAILMNLFTDLEPKVQWKLLNKLVQTLIACLCIVLEGFADVIVEDR